MHSTRWVVLAQSMKIGAQLVNLFVLSRLLQPADYGVMAIGGVAINLAMLLRDLGTANTVIQRATLNDRLLGTIFSLNLVLGLAACALTAASSAGVAAFFDTPRVQDILFWLALTFPLTASTLVHQALMERASRFRALALIEGASAVLSLTCAVVAALCGAGVYSLVLQYMVYALANALLLWRVSGWRAVLVFDRAELRQVWAYTWNMAGFQLNGFVFRNADSMLVGKLLGATQLGLYALAYKIMLFPVQNLSWVCSRALFPAMSRAQDSREEVRAMFLKATGFLAFISAPLMGGLIALNPEFSTWAFGDRWVGVSPVISTLAVVGVLQALNTPTTLILMALGRSELLFRAALLGSLLHLGAFWLGTRWGALGVAGAYVAASVLSVSANFLLALRVGDMPVRAVLREVLGPLACAVAMIGVMESCVAALSGYAAWLRLGTTVLIGAAVYLALALAFMRPRLWAAAMFVGVRPRLAAP
jgi:PST family polysaccharide transporter